MNEKIVIKGAREHNLKNIDIEIPRNKLVVITGLSGSGKSSLAFDTIYAEGQRRYVESLSAYARQFLGLMEKPDADYISGLSPAISIDQKTTNKNPRSTIGTITEIYDYLRLLYARIGIPHCPECGEIITSQTIDQIVDKIMKFSDGTKIQVLAPIVRGRKGEYKKEIQEAQKNGYVRVRVDGITYNTEDDIEIDKNKKHNIEIIVDRLVIKRGLEKRLADSLETVFDITDGIVVIDVVNKEEILFSQKLACNNCGISINDFEPRMFSFNNPFGACPTCSGLGNLLEIDPDLVIPDKSKSIREGAINVNSWGNVGNDDSYSMQVLNCVAKHFNFSLDIPIKELPIEYVNILLYGTGKEKIHIEYTTRVMGSGSYYSKFEGIVNIMKRRYDDTQSENQKQYYEGYMSDRVCPHCKGARLKKESLSVLINDINIKDLADKSIINIKSFFDNVKLNQKEKIIAEQILKEIKARLQFLIDVGLDYLTLSRPSATLSGGEAQRIRLATQIGSGLMGVLYILDEPSIGLHQRDNEKLLETLKRLRDLGNTLIVVEHDEDTMYEADYIIDMGPEAGVHGGEVVFAGKVEDIKKCDASITGKYLSGKLSIPLPKTRLNIGKKILQIKGASENNLKNIDVDIPLGIFTCVTGVSGSGKSSLINQILYKTLAVNLNGAKLKPGKHDSIKGMEYLDKVINIDQSPIGRTPRSNPVTYTGVFDFIRALFASTSEAKARGYTQGRFSFNIKGGRCEACSGDGIIKIEMHFLPDVYVPCEVCNGNRYNRETLEVRYKGKNIYEVLDMTVEESIKFFENIPKIYNKLKTLYDVGLGYIKLGQSSTTLSGGEAQRIKLATELSKRATGKTMYILDEPTTGLHVADVHKLIEIIHKLVKGGNTVVVIEHNLDVIKTADYIIDMGPEGGEKGGFVIAQGTPEELIKVEKSYTAKFLKNFLK